jgi:hypothetical protein
MTIITYFPRKTIRISELLGGRLAEYHIIEQSPPERERLDTHILFDGKSRVWVHGRDYVEALTQYEPSFVPLYILGAIARVFETDFVSDEGV